jgi:hypothetical protein
VRVTCRARRSTGSRTGAHSPRSNAPGTGFTGRGYRPFRALGASGSSRSRVWRRTSRVAHGPESTIMAGAMTAAPSVREHGASRHIPNRVCRTASIASDDPVISKATSRRPKRKSSSSRESNVAGRPVAPAALSRPCLFQPTRARARRRAGGGIGTKGHGRRCERGRRPGRAHSFAVRDRLLGAHPRDGRRTR